MNEPFAAEPRKTGMFMCEEAAHLYYGASTTCICGQRTHDTPQQARLRAFVEAVAAFELYRDPSLDETIIKAREALRPVGDEPIDAIEPIDGKIC